MTNQQKWDNRFFGVCNEIASWSSCLSRKIGAILVRDRTIISLGYNGPPRGIPHCGTTYPIQHINKPIIGDSSMCPRQRIGFKSGEGLHLCPAVHAEDNCISNAARTGVSTVGTTIYMSCGRPCKDCIKKIINAGIVEIVCATEESYDELSQWLLKESNVKMRIKDMI